jgi:ribosomal protein S18 acetylase RimI-like enzyme
MTLDLESLPPREPAPERIAIAEAIEPGDVRDALDLIAWRWEVPSRLAPDLAAATRAFELAAPGSAVRAWLARRDGVPLAKVVLHLAAGAAGIYGVVTRPEARGAGLARRMTIEALHAARAAGYRLAVLHSTPMARSLYERIGFRARATFRVFAPPRALHL